MELDLNKKEKEKVKKDKIKKEVILSRGKDHLSSKGYLSGIRIDLLSKQFTSISTDFVKLRRKRKKFDFLFFSIL